MAWARVVLTKVLDSFPRAFRVNGGRIAQWCASWAELANTFHNLSVILPWLVQSDILTDRSYGYIQYSTRGRHVPVTSLSIAGLIPQSRQLQAQVKSVSLGWHQNSWACAKSYARISVCFCSQVGGGASIRLLTQQLQSCNWNVRAVMFVRLAQKVVMQN
jgi:hypothetical protein